MRDNHPKRISASKLTLMKNFNNPYETSKH